MTIAVYWGVKQQQNIYHHHQHNHHFHLKPVFLYRGLGLSDETSSKAFFPLRTILRVSSWVLVASVPGICILFTSFLIFFLSSTSTTSHVFFGLPGLFHATSFNLCVSAIQPVLHSTCPNHLTLLLQSTISKSQMPSFDRRVFALSSPFALTLQIQ